MSCDIVVHHVSCHFSKPCLHRPHSQITAFLADYPEALSRASALDAQVRKDAEVISPEYADIVELSMRQSFGATEITISGSEGAWNTSDVLMFIKGDGPLYASVPTSCA